MASGDATSTPTGAHQRGSNMGSSTRVQSKNRAPKSGGAPKLKIRVLFWGSYWSCSYSVTPDRSFLSSLSPIHHLKRVEIEQRTTPTALPANASAITRFPRATTRPPPMILTLYLSPLELQMDPHLAGNQCHRHQSSS